jgi:polyhydroxyalkanoate synthesis regulator phasin
MTKFTDLVKKTLYLGVGAAAYAGEKASHTLKDLQKASPGLRNLQEQAQSLVNGLVERGEVTAEEAQKIMNEWVKRHQNGADQVSPRTPRPIPIDEQPMTPADPLAGLREQVAHLRQELDNLRQKGRNS